VKRLLALFVLIVASAAAHAEAPVILVFGDSISAGYGLAPEQGWVELLKTRLKSQGYGYQVVNAAAKRPREASRVYRVRSSFITRALSSSSWAAMTACARCRLRRCART
jgi:acyl-CoA thioesterase I